MQSIPTSAEIPQGSSLSPILYMYYNADLLEIPQQINQNMEDLSLGFIDDITYGVAELTDEGNVDRLQTIFASVKQ